MERATGEESCELCGRRGLLLTIHHLIPKDEGGKKKQTIRICRACHSQIHATFTNKELAGMLNNLDAIRSDERINRFLKWVRKQSVDRKIRVRRERARKERK